MDPMTHSCWLRNFLRSCWRIWILLLINLQVVGIGTILRTDGAVVVSKSDSRSEMAINVNLYFSMNRIKLPSTCEYTEEEASLWAYLETMKGCFKTMCNIWVYRPLVNVDVDDGKNPWFRPPGLLRYLDFGLNMIKYTPWRSGICSATGGLSTASEKTYLAGPFCNIFFFRGYALKSHSAGLIV